MNIDKVRPTLWGALIGILMTPCLLYVAFVYSIHGGLDLAALLFPYAVIASPTMQAVTGFAMLLAAIQFPIYGIVVGTARPRGRRRWLYVGALVLVVHCAGAVVAYQRVTSAPLVKYARLRSNLNYTERPSRSSASPLGGVGASGRQPERAAAV